MNGKTTKSSLLADIRQVVADYMQSEGCTCCQNVEAHKQHTALLAKLLRVPMYSDKSGYDFARFRTGARKGIEE